MAGTVAASPKVASTVGLKDVVIAELTEDTEATLTYGDLQKLAGAIEASITPDNADPAVQYYDDIEGDVLYHDYCGRLAHGDAIVISNCGSYSLVMKPPFILPNFPVLDICGNGVEVIKRGEVFDDLFHTFKF